MVNKAQTGMQGVYLVAAELTGRGFIVSVTSRSAFGADLLVTDQRCRTAWSVQVKTNYVPRTFWLLNKHSKEIKSPTHVYIFVNLNGSKQPDYYVVPSKSVAKDVDEGVTPSGTWYQFDIKRAKLFVDRWDEVFSNPIALPEAESEPSSQISG
jgi:hypothetical protein